MKQIEQTILKNLIYNEDYSRKVLPFLKDEYFLSVSEKVVFQEIDNFIKKYNSLPTIEALNISLSEKKGIGEEDFKEALGILDSIEKSKNEEKSDPQWLLDASEAFCKEKALHIAMIESISILDNPIKSKKNKEAIPSILTDALAVTFDPHVGHDYLENSENRFEFYHKIEKKIPFDIEIFNTITKGGFSTKTLNCFMGGTGYGKTGILCHFAASALTQGYNVLYITLEMAEEKIAERIDANLLNVEIDDLLNLPKELYDRKVQKIKEKTQGKLIIKEYPTASANAMHFRSLLNELNLKRNFRPDIIFVDYINICSSSRLKLNSSVNSYSFVKAIAEELRGLGVEYKVPLVTATQTNRDGFSSSDVGMENVSESFGLPATADFMAVIISNEELDKLGQVMIKQLKNRYSDVSKNRRFCIGFDKAKMRLFEVGQTAQENIVETESPVFDHTETSKKFDKFQY